MRLLSFETLLYVIIVSLFGFTLLIVFSGKRQPSYGSVAVDSSKATMLIKAEVIMPEIGDLEKLSLKTLSWELHRLLDVKDNSSAFQTTYDIVVRNATTSELDVISGSPIHDIHDFEVALTRASGLLSRGHYRFYVLPENIANRYMSSDKDVALGLTRNVIIKVEDTLLHEFEKSFLVEYIAITIDRTLREVLVNEADLSRAFNIATKEWEKRRADRRWPISSSPGYELLFTLWNPQPEMVELDWNMKEGFYKHLAPFVAPLHESAIFEAKFQHIHKDKLFKPKYSSMYRCHILETSELPNILNKLLPDLGLNFRRHSSLNFVIYVPKREEAPLYISSEGGRKDTREIFIISGWGIFMVYNYDTPLLTYLIENLFTSYAVKVDTKKIFNSITIRLPTLLGFKKMTGEYISTSKRLSHLIVDHWRHDMWHFEREVIRGTADTTAKKSSFLDVDNRFLIRDEKKWAEWLNEPQEEFKIAEEETSFLMRSYMVAGYLVTMPLWLPFVARIYNNVYSTIQNLRSSYHPPP